MWHFPAAPPAPATGATLSFVAPPLFLGPHITVFGADHLTSALPTHVQSVRAMSCGTCAPRRLRAQHGPWYRINICSVTGLEKGTTRILSLR